MAKHITRPALSSPLGFLLWPLLFIGQTLAVALLSWHLMAQVHFAYPLGYPLLGLEQHIAEYAPLNRHRAGFEQVSPSEHIRLFGAISDAVQNSGRGLQVIEYHLASGEAVPLMHQAEIIHLQDVADLIDHFYNAALIGLGLWLLTLAYVYWRGWQLPKTKHLLAGFGGTLALALIALLIIGPTKVFYWLHVQVFPAEHQWFFYYEDSLMTTLMKAPDIFAFIGALLLLLLVGAWLVSFYAMRWLLLQRSAQLPAINPPPASKQPSAKARR